MIIEEMSEKFAGMLRDESRMAGHAEAVARPRDADQLAQAVKYAAQNGMRITVQGAATGVEGGGVPQGGLLISTRGMNRVLGLREDGGSFFLQAQAGVTLEQVEEHLRKPLGGRAYFFPPNPTEKTATLGGAFASDAIGTNGRVRGHVRRVSRVEGVIAELELALRPVPKFNWGVLLFFMSPGGANQWYESQGKPWTRAAPRSGVSDLARNKFARATASVGFAGHAYFDTAALTLLRGHHNGCKPPGDVCEAIYLELWDEDEAALEEELAAILELFLEAGGREEYAWAAEGLAEMEKFRAMCHAVPELINSEMDKTGAVAPGLCKAALDRLYVSLDRI